MHDTPGIPGMQDSGGLMAWSTQPCMVAHQHLEDILPLHPLTTENGIFPTRSVKKECQQLQPHLRWAGEFRGNSGRKEYLPSSSHQTATTSLWWALRKFRMWKHGIVAPDSWGAYQRNDFSEPRLLHLPIHRKVPNSLTWDIWFSLIYQNLLMFRLLALCCKAPVHHGFPPHLLRTFL